MAAGAGALTVLVVIAAVIAATRDSPGTNGVPAAQGQALSAEGGAEPPPVPAAPVVTEPAKTPPSEPAPVEPTWGPVTELTPIGVNASAERESAFLRCTGTYTTYEARQLVDGDLDTGWGAGADDGKGQTVTLDFGQPVRLTEVALTPGYAKVGPRADQGCASTLAFDFNRFVPAVQWSFDDGSSVVQRFEQSPDLQSHSVDVVTSRVVLTILETSMPPGADDDTVLSEARFLGSTS